MREEIVDKHNKRVAEIVDQLLDGGSDEYRDLLLSCPFDFILSSIHIPIWMFRKWDDFDLNLTDIEKVCLSVTIHFTKTCTPTGYMECSGLVEKYCMCDVADVDKAFSSLIKRKLVFYKELSPSTCYGHKRNRGFIANVPMLREILENYKLNVWV